MTVTLPTTEQFRAARNSMARATMWLGHITASHDAENEGTRKAAFEDFTEAAATLGFDLAPRLEGKNERAA